MDAAIAQGLLHRLLNQGCWVVLMQSENAHKFFHSTAFRPFFLQESQQTMVRLRPLLAPALEWASILKGTWPLLEQCQVMQRVEDILRMAVTAGMARNHLALMQDINAEGIGFDHQLASRLLNRNRVAVGVIDHL